MPNIEIPLSLGYSVVLAPSLAGLREAIVGMEGVSRVFVVSNPIVVGLHGAALRAELRSFVQTEWFEIPDGESYKTLATWSALLESMLAHRPDRQTVVLAFGGGVVGDLAGFAAASLLRGVRLVQVPTTLLAMVDASVGGKTGVNATVGKNLVGAFHQPSLVWAPLDCLQTLPEAELRCGLGEVAKHMILDGRAAVSSCLDLAQAARRGESAALASLVTHSVRLKAAVVEADPKEEGKRALLNLGHTLAHGVEVVAGFGQVRHGEAVAMGLVAIAAYAVHTKRAPESMIVEVSRLIEALGLATRPPAGLTPDDLAHAMRFDKKRGRGMVRLVVPFDLGDVRLCDVDEHELAVLARCSGAGASK